MVSGRLTKEAPGNGNVCIVPIGELDIANGQDLQIGQLVQTRAVNGKQNGPNKTAAGHTNDDQHSEEAKEEEAIQGAVV